LRQTLHTHALRETEREKKEIVPERRLRVSVVFVFYTKIASSSSFPNNNNEEK